MALHKQKTDISCESDNKLDEGIFLDDGLTEMWSKVKILMTYNLTRLDLRHDDSSVFVHFSLFLCCRLAVTVTFFKTEYILKEKTFKKAFVKS